jgi:hypothetical protein
VAQLFSLGGFEYMRTYYRSFWHWLRWVVWLSVMLFWACFAHLADRYPIGKIVMTVFMGIGFIVSLYVFLRFEPYAIRIYSDRFEARYILGRRVYYYADVTDVSLDVVPCGNSGHIGAVRVDFRSDRRLMLSSLISRHKLYEDLHTSWRAAA